MHLSINCRCRTRHIRNVVDNHSRLYYIKWYSVSSCHSFYMRNVLNEVQWHRQIRCLSLSPRHIFSTYINENNGVPKCYKRQNLASRHQFSITLCSQSQLFAYSDFETYEFIGYTVQTPALNILRTNHICKNRMANENWFRAWPDMQRRKM